MRPDKDQRAGNRVITGDGAGAARRPDADLNSGKAWTERSRIVLTPIAAPSILGLFGFAGATFMVASLLAGWWGSPTSVLWLLAAGSGLLAAGLVGGIHGLVTVGGWLLVASAAAAFYTAGAMMLASATGGRTALPMGNYNASANVRGRRTMEPVSYPAGLPGARVGQ